MRGYILDPETGEVAEADFEEGVAYKTVPHRFLPDEHHDKIVYERSYMRMDVNSLGKDDDGVRRFLKSVGEKPSLGRVHEVGREIRRTEAENRRVEQRHKEVGGPKLVDKKGRDVLAARKRQIKRSGWKGSK